MARAIRISVWFSSVSGIALQRWWIAQGINMRRWQYARTAADLEEESGEFYGFSIPRRETGREERVHTNRHVRAYYLWKPYL